MKKISNLTLKVYHQIIELMLNYEIVPGQRLVFVDLARQLKVSRTPVNNALSILAQEGYLDFVPHQGYSVHRITKKEAENLFEIREVLEVGFLGKAIRNMSERQLGRVRKSLETYESAISDRVDRRLFILDTDFHLAVLEGAGNEILTARYQDVCRKIFLRFRTEQLVRSRIEEISREHRDLYEAVKIKDVALAKEHVLLHYRNSRNSLFPIIFADE